MYTILNSPSPVTVSVSSGPGCLQEGDAVGGSWRCTLPSPGPSHPARHPAAVQTAPAAEGGIRHRTDDIIRGQGRRHEARFVGAGAGDRATPPAPGGKCWRTRLNRGLQTGVKYAYNSVQTGQGLTLRRGVLYVTPAN